MRKKHGTVQTAVRPSGSVNRDRFGLFQPLNDVVQLLFFFFSLNGIVLKRLQHIFFSLLYGVVLPSLKITLLKPFLISQSLSTLTRLYLSQKSLSILTLSSLNHSLVVASLPRATALSQLNLSPSRRRTVAA